MNEYDSTKITNILNTTYNIITTNTPNNADMILFNTYSIHKKAQKKIFHDLDRIKHLKQTQPNIIININNYIANQKNTTIIAHTPYIDLIFSPQTLHQLPKMLTTHRTNNTPQINISFPEIEKFDHLPPTRTTNNTALISIIKKYNKYYNFYIIPYTHNKKISHPLNNILTEITELTKQNIKKITLLNQNINAYQDRIKNNNTTNFALLLEYTTEIPTIERIRYTTSHPKKFTQHLINIYSRLPQLINHIHLPIQSDSNRMLAMIKHNYNILEYKSIVRQLRKAHPDLCISSDFIIGFPNETDTDFKTTLKLTTNLDFNTSFNFVFSPHPNTPTTELPDTTPHETKLAQLQRLQTLIDAQTLTISQTIINTIQRILIENTSRKNTHKLTDHTNNNRIINFTNSPQLTNQFINITITTTRPHSLHNEIALAHA